MEIAERATFRVTRDADFDVSDDAADLLEAVESELRRRRFGDVVRLEISASASRKMLDPPLTDGLGTAREQVYEIESQLDLADLSQIAGLDRPELKDEPWLPVTQPRLARIPSAAARFFDEPCREQTSSSTSPTSPSARASRRSPRPRRIPGRDRDQDDGVPDQRRLGTDRRADRLRRAGEAVRCLVQLKARFDERRNIEWSRAMEQAGVHVVHGFSDLKIHAKMALVVRREGDALRRYVHIGSGNYNAATSRLYEDVGVVHRRRGDRGGRG